MADTYIKRKREASGMSQSQFAEMSGVNLRSLQDYEQGRKPMTSVKGEVLYRISTALDCSMEDLILEPVYPADDSSGRLYKYYIQFQEIFKLCCETEEKQGKVDNIYTPFDDVFRTLSVDCSSLLLPVINEAFGEHYSQDNLIEHGQDNHLNVQDNGELHKIISDSNFVIVAREGQRIRYQIECQSVPDNSIILRIFEYASAIASEHAEVTSSSIRIAYPRSALIYLRTNANTPDEMMIQLDTPGGEIAWNVPVIKTQSFTIDDIFEKRLYMFIPYYILTYEKELKDAQPDSAVLEEIKEVYSDIRKRLDMAVEHGYLSEYEKGAICSLSVRVLSYFSSKCSELRKEVIPVMGGKVLEYEAKTIRREALRKGREQGREEVLNELLKTGIIDTKTLDNIYNHIKTSGNDQN